MANWVQTLPVSHGSDILFKRLAVQRALNAARDCCFLNKATVLNTKQVFDVLYLVLLRFRFCYKGLLDLLSHVFVFTVLIEILIFLTNIL